MATLQKFKLLASQCAVAGSPTRSPTTSPVIHLRRRKTLRMLLARTAHASGRQRLPRHADSPDRPPDADDPTPKGKVLAVRHKLRDLFVSSPPLEDRASDKNGNVVEEGLLPATARAGSGATARRGAAGALRPLSAAFRSRLLRRPWRPVLVTIAE